MRERAQGDVCSSAWPVSEDMSQETLTPETLSLALRRRSIGVSCWLVKFFSGRQATEAHHSREGVVCVEGKGKGLTDLVDECADGAWWQ
jgi:hypothetical protein